jgi:hypothetical protein
LDAHTHEPPRSMPSAVAYARPPSLELASSTTTLRSLTTQPPIALFLMACVAGGAAARAQGRRGECPPAETSAVAGEDSPSRHQPAQTAAHDDRVHVLGCARPAPTTPVMVVVCSTPQCPRTTACLVNHPILSQEHSWKPSGGMRCGRICRAGPGAVSHLPPGHRTLRSSAGATRHPARDDRDARCGLAGARHHPPAVWRYGLKRGA